MKHDALRRCPGGASVTIREREFFSRAAKLPLAHSATIIVACFSRKTHDDAARLARGGLYRSPFCNMGPDPSLRGGYPFVYISGEKYYYGKEPVSGEWLVAHETYGKWSWCFKYDKQAMIDFLENLPESATPPIVGGVPVWSQVLTAEESHRAWREHDEKLKQLLEERRRTGRTHPYDKDALQE